jgi:hypothetical protein
VHGAQQERTLGNAFFFIAKAGASPAAFGEPSRNAGRENTSCAYFDRLVAAASIS